MENITLEMLLNSLPYCAWISLENGDIVLSNSFFKSYLGTDINTESKLFGVIHPDDLSEFKQSYSEGCQKIDMNKCIVRIRRSADHTYQWCIVGQYPMFGPDNRFYGFVGAFIHFSDIMTTLQDGLMVQYYISKFEDFPFGFLMMDQDDNILLCNKKCETITGRSKEDLQKTKWMILAHSDEMYSYNIERLKSGEQDHFHSVGRIVRPDQSIVWVFVSVLTVQEHGKMIGKYAFVIHDITENVLLVEQSKALQRFLSVFMADKAGMLFRCKPENQNAISYVSEGCFRLTGYDRRFLLQNDEFYFTNVIDQEYREYMAERRNEAISEKRIHKDEYEITTSTGEKKWVYEQVRGIYNEYGKCIMIEGLVSDITEAKSKDCEIIRKQYHDADTNLYNRRFLKAACRNLDRMGLVPVTVVLIKVNGLRLAVEALGRTVKGELMISMAQAITESCSEQHIVTVTGEDEFIIVMPESDFDQAYKLIQQIRLRMRQKRRKMNSKSGLISAFFGCATKEDAEESLFDTIIRAEKNLYNPPDEEKSYAAFPSIYNTQKTLSTGHMLRGLRLKKLCCRIGERYGLDEREMYRLEILSAVHNIGISGVSTHLLFKRGDLTEEEWAVMKMHPMIGYRMAIASVELGCVADEILHHHEWWNGNGYPMGQKGENIPFLSRILSVVDAYDAMTNERSYRQSLSKKEALEQIKKNAGIQFDPDVVRVFLSLMEEEEFD